MKSNIKTLLLNLEINLNNASCPVLKYLNPGISKFEVDILLREFDFKLPNGCYSLYAWKNGTNNRAKGVETWLFPLGMFSSIENSINLYKSFVGKDAYWYKTMFLIFEGGGTGDWYLIECNRQSPFYGMIFLHSRTNVDFNIIISIYDSVNSLIRTLSECFSVKAYYYENNSFRFNPEKHIEISKSNNPRAEFWKIS